MGPAGLRTDREENVLWTFLGWGQAVGVASTPDYEYPFLGILFKEISLGDFKSSIIIAEHIFMLCSKLDKF
jgi:hypothetical protein